MLITNEVFSDYLTCKYKTYQKLNGKQEIKSDYELLQIELENNYKKEVLEKLVVPGRNNSDVSQFSLTTTDLKRRQNLITGISIVYYDQVIYIDALEKVSGKSKLGLF